MPNEEMIQKRWGAVGLFVEGVQSIMGFGEVTVGRDAINGVFVVKWTGKAGDKRYSTETRLSVLELDKAYSLFAFGQIKAKVFKRELSQKGRTNGSGIDGSGETELT